MTNKSVPAVKLISISPGKPDFAAPPVERGGFSIPSYPLRKRLTRCAMTQQETDEWEITEGHEGSEIWRLSRDSSKPGQVRMGRRGYLGKRGSVFESVQR